MSSQTLKKCAAVIPARGGSQGIPRKNLIEIAGRPMLAWTVEAALESKHLHKEVYVSSDDDEILETAQRLGALTIKRPAEFATHTASSESVLLHALDELESKGTSLDYLVFLQPTSPIRNLGDIDRAIEHAIKTNADSLFSSEPVRDYFLWSRDAIGGLHGINHDWRIRKRRQELPVSYHENGSLFVIRPKILREFKHRFGGKIETYCMDAIASLQVDTPEDLELVRFFMEKRAN